MKVSLEVGLAALCACHGSATFEMPRPPAAARSQILAIEDPAGARRFAHAPAGEAFGPMAVREGSILTLMFHGRTADELFFGDRPPHVLHPFDEAGLRPLPAFDAAVRVKVPELSEWAPVAALDPFARAARIDGPSREACAARGGFYASDDAAADFDCFVSEACRDHGGCYTGELECPLPCPEPAPPSAPDPPDPPSAFPPPPARIDCPEGQVQWIDRADCERVDGACPADEWPTGVPAGAAYVRPGAAGGDGTRLAPFGSVDEALALSGTVALSKGDHGAIAPAVSARILGACRETVLRSADIRTHIRLSGLSIVGAVTVAPDGRATLDGVEAASIHVEGIVEGRRIAAGPVSMSGGTADLEEAVLGAVAASGADRIALGEVVVGGLRIAATSSVGLASVLVAGSSSAAVSLEGSAVAARYLTVRDPGGAGLIVGGGSLDVEGLSVERARGIGVEIVGGRSDLRDVRVLGTMVGPAIVSACGLELDDPVSIGVLVLCADQPPALAECTQRIAEPQAFLERVHIQGEAAPDARSSMSLWVGYGGAVHLEDAAIEVSSALPSTNHRGIRVEELAALEGRRLSIEGPSWHGYEVRGGAVVADVDIRGAVLGVLNGGAEGFGCMERLRIVDSLSLGLCVDQMSRAVLRDVDVSRPSVDLDAPAFAASNLCIDLATEAGSGVRIHQGSTVDLARFRIAESHDVGLHLGQLAASRITIADGFVERNRVAGARVPSPIDGVSFPLEKIMVRVRYESNAEPFVLEGGR